MKVSARLIDLVFVNAGLGIRNYLRLRIVFLLMCRICILNTFDPVLFIFLSLFCTFNLYRLGNTDLFYLFIHY